MTHRHHPPYRLTRREFLRVTSAAVGGLLLADTLPAAADPPEKPFTVALGHAGSYDPKLIHNAVFDMLDKLGGLADVVRRGDTVAIKTNLTGGTWYQGLLDFPATDAYVTHPQVVRALGEAVLDAGARRLYIVESVYDQRSFVEWGHTDVAKSLGATLVNLNFPDPYEDFVTREIKDGLIYDEFTINPVLEDADVFMSVAKLKCHREAGITLSMKNLVGMVPAEFYRLSDTDNTRTGMHGVGDEYQDRLPRVIVDLNRARPIDFALIDGIKTSEVAEGPWVNGWTPIEDVVGALVAGKNPVATDAVAAAVMGFDPMAEGKQEVPFKDCLNHLMLAAAAGLGSPDLERIKIVGLALDDLRYEFTSYSQAQEPADAEAPS